MEENKNTNRDEIYSEKVKAGKRTYFFDVKSTRGNDFYVTITESKKRYNADNEGFSYEKHKIFLYKEDFHRFMEALNNTLGHVKNELMPDVDFAALEHKHDNQDKEAVPTKQDSELRWD